MRKYTLISFAVAMAFSFLLVACTVFKKTGEVKDLDVWGNCNTFFMQKLEEIHFYKPQNPDILFLLSNCNAVIWI